MYSRGPNSGNRPPTLPEPVFPPALMMEKLMEDLLEVAVDEAPVARTCPVATPVGAEHLVGIVTGCDAERVNISSGGWSAMARPATSCLLRLMPGDTVLCLRVAPQELWVLQVLQREEGVANIICCPTDSRIEAADGRLRIKADTLQIQVDELRIAAQLAEITGQQIRLIGQSVKLVGKVLYSMFDRISQFCRHSLRTTEGLDRVQAGQLDFRAKQLARVSGEHTLIEGEKLVKTRGRQIHFG
jgi:hypothetical protein